MQERGQIMLFNMPWMSYLIICPLSFLAGFIDSIAGGGGLISVPAYTLANTPTQNLLGTNKLSSSIGTSIASYKMIRSKNVHYPTGILSCIGALIGSAFGARLTLLLDPRSIKIMVLVLAPILLAFFILKKDIVSKENFLQKKPWQIYVLAAVSGLFIGAYDGVFGPGTGTFLLMFNVGVIGMPIVTALGNSKLTNLSSNIAALTVFIISGRVMFGFGLCAAVFNALGNFIGASLAIKKGIKAIGLVFVIVMVALAVKTANDLFGIL